MFGTKYTQLDLQKIKHKMKNILLILLFLGMLLVSTDLSAQDKLDKIAEQQIETNKQIAELAKQQAVANARFETKFEGIDKRFEAVDKRFDDANRRMDMLFYMMMALLAGIFGLIGFVVWYRYTSIKPILDENITLKKEIEQLAQRELRHEEAVAKNFKKILDKFPDLVGLT